MRQTHKYRRLRPSVQWLPIVRDVLSGDGKARNIARAILWQEVQYFVQFIVKLPIGPLNEDDEARADIALRVLQKLEAKSNANLVEWLARQVRQRDHASFWGWVKTIAWSTAIDYARTSRRNIARRGENFEWIRLDCVDPRLLGEALGNPRSFLPCGSDQDVEEFLADFQHCLRVDDAAVVALIEGDDTRAVDHDRWP
jgi:hypothetical protein